MHVRVEVGTVFEESELSSWGQIEPHQVYEVVYQGRWMKREPPVAGQHGLGAGRTGVAARKVRSSNRSDRVASQRWIEVTKGTWLHCTCNSC